MAEPTLFARKYLAADPSLQPNPNQTKSLLTPVSPNFNSNQGECIAEKYQRAQLNGYTTRELIDLDAISNRELRPISLENPVHEIFAKDRWTLLDSPPHIIWEADNSNGTNYWEAQNTLVWSKLEPCLRLASRMVSNLHKHPWFDGLMLGDREEIDESWFPTSAKLELGVAELQRLHKSFKLRPPGPKNADQCQDVVQEVTRDIFLKILRFGFKSPQRVPVTFRNLRLSAEKTQKVLSTLAITHLNGDTGIIEVWLTYNMVQPLLDLNGDLNSAEKLAAQLYLALAMVHELMHVFFLARCIMKYDVHTKKIVFNSTPLKEPYFVDEPVCETGWSEENAVFGGNAWPFFMPPKPPLALYQRNFPTPGVGFATDLIIPPFPSYSINYPLPVTFFEALHSEDFWDVHFQNYGMLRLKHASASYRLASDPNAAWTIVDNPDNLQILRPDKTAQSFAALLALTPDERATQEQQMKSDAVRLLQEKVVRRRKQMAALMAEGEACGRLVGRSTELIHAVLSLVPMLEIMVVEHRTVVKELLQFEKNGQAPRLIDHRNDFQSYNRNLRLFTLRFTGSGYQPLELRLDAVLFMLEETRLLLSPGTANPSGITETGALTVQARAEVDENKLLLKAAKASDDGDLPTARSICEQLLGSMGCTLFAQSCCRIILADDESIPVSDRLKDVKRALGTLLKITPSLGWTTDLQRVISKARMSVDALSKLALDEMRINICSSAPYWF